MLTIQIEAADVQTRWRLRPVPSLVWIEELVHDLGTERLTEIAKEAAVTRLMQEID